MSRSIPVVLVTVLLASGGPLLGADKPSASLRHFSVPATAHRYAHSAEVGAPIPAFARLYGTGCSTCHTAAPKLNVLGEAFRLGGYQMPENDLLVRQDQPVALGAEPWKDLWPRAVWPSDLPGIAPIALRIQTDVRAIGEPDGRRVDFDFPHEVYLLAGAPLGDDIAAFLEMEWHPDRGVRIIQAKVKFQDFLPGLPEGAANLWVGRQDPFLLTFTDRQIDRAGVVGFSWQRFSLSQMSLTGPAGVSQRSVNGLALGGGLPTIEVNGVLGGRLHYGLGLSRGAGAGSSDNNGAKDPYYRLRYKWGGLNLRGQYSPGGGPVLGAGGQLQDRSLILEHFGYRGNEATEAAPSGHHWAMGFSARVLNGPWDAGAGWVHRAYERPFDTVDGSLRGSAWFSKLEYLLFPWLLGSLKYDSFGVSADPGAIPAGFSLDPADRHTIAPGAVFLVRQNVRAVLESRFYLDGDSARSGGRTAPGDFFLRLDVTF
jgi:hypothetical protein